MYIGELSKKSGTSIKAIRYYEEIGLIKTPERNGKYRIYDKGYLPVLGMISMAKKLGFTLAELQVIAKAKNQKGLVPMDLLKSEIDQKRKILLSKIAVLNESIEGLAQLEVSVERYNECLLVDLSIS